MFDRKIAEDYLNKLLKQYKIKVVSWSKSSCGNAYPSKKEVKIPKPTDIDRFCVALHEIKHIIDGHVGYRYIKEYNCERFAIENAEELGFSCDLYKERARRYIIMNIAKGFCRGLKLSKINEEIKSFCNIDFSTWEGHKVFVSGWGLDAYKGRPLEIFFF